MYAGLYTRPAKVAKGVIMKKTVLGIMLLALSSVSLSAFSANNKVEICHKGREVSVAQSGVPGHENHGDTLGECDGEGPDTMAAVVMMRCEAIVGNGVVVVSASSSVDLDIPVIEIFPPVDFDCAQVLAALLNSDTEFRLRSITSGSANSGEASDEDLHLYTDYLLIGRVPAGS